MRLDDPAFVHTEAQQLFARYAHRFDDGKLEAWSELFTEGATLHLRGTEVVGREAIRRHITQNVPPTAANARHLITNVELVSPVSPITVTADFELVVVEAGAARIQLLGRYTSELERGEDDEIRFAQHRATFLLDW